MSRTAAWVMAIASIVGFIAPAPLRAETDAAVVDTPTPRQARQPRYVFPFSKVEVDLVELAPPGVDETDEQTAARVERKLAELSRD